MVVHSRNGETYLLVYHARMYPDTTRNRWNAPASDQRLPLELVPSLVQGKLTVRTLWQGQPVAAAEVKAVPAGGDAIEGTSNSAGEFAVSANQAGTYAFRAKYVEKIAGEREGKKFQTIRHYSTLVVTIAVDRAVKATAQRPAKGSKRMTMNSKRQTQTATTRTAAKPPGALPDLPFGVTSFGAAIVDNNIYVCGGHLGPAHDYDREGQSDRLLRLDLRSPQRWEVVGSVPRLAGLAMVASGGKIYRIGGFEAQNRRRSRPICTRSPTSAATIRRPVIGKTWLPCRKAARRMTRSSSAVGFTSWGAGSCGEAAPRSGITRPCKSTWLRRARVDRVAQAAVPPSRVGARRVPGKTLRPRWNARRRRHDNDNVRVRSREASVVGRAEAAGRGARGIRRLCRHLPGATLHDDVLGKSLATVGRWPRVACRGRARPVALLPSHVVCERLVADRPRGRKHAGGEGSERGNCSRVCKSLSCRTWVPSGRSHHRIR